MSITVVHLVATLRDGGAEALLRGLLPRLVEEADLRLHVVSIYDSRLSDVERVALGAPVYEIRRRGRKDVFFALKLISTLRHIRPDVVHLHLHSGKYAGRVAAIVAGVPSIVFTEHGDEAGGILRSCIKRLLNMRTARFIVFSELERARYADQEHIPLSKIEVIPNGIVSPRPTDTELTRAELGLKKNDFAIVAPARLAPQKNQALLLHATAALVSSGRSNVRLIVIGDGPDAAALQALAIELSLTAIVSFLGYRNDSVRLIAACNLMALPSLWEKMPLVLGEAMLTGVPVVSTPWTGVETFIEDDVTGYVAADWTVAALAAALERPLDDPIRREFIVTHAMQQAAVRYDLSRTAMLHAILYRKLVTGFEHQEKRIR